MREKLAHEYVKDYNAEAAALRAGFSASVARKKAGSMVKEMMPTIERLQQKKNTAMLQRGIMSQEEVLQGMTNIGRVNALDYIKIVPIEVGRGKKKETRFVAQLKPITDLTREQADAITEIEQVGSEVRYKLPNVEGKMAARAFLGKHWGLTDPKLVSMRVTQHINLTADLKDVDSGKLEQLEQHLVDLLGPAARRLLGYRAGDDEQQQEPVEAEVVEHTDYGDDEDEE